MKDILPLKTILALIGLILAGMVVSLFIPKNNPVAVNSPVERIPDTPYEVVVKGTLVCLQTTVTMEVNGDCKQGLAAEDGKKYALNLAAHTGVTNMLQINDTVTVEGILLPIEQISTDQWYAYNIVGIITVNSITK